MAIVQSIYGKQQHNCNRSWIFSKVQEYFQLTVPILLWLNPPNGYTANLWILHNVCTHWDLYLLLWIRSRILHFLFHMSVHSLFCVVMSSAISAYNDVRLVSPPVGCIIFSYVICVSWCSTRLDYMSNTASYKRQTLFTYLEHMSSHPVIGESVLIVFLVFCVVCFVCFRHVSCLPNVASVSGLTLLDCPFCFSNVYSTTLYDTNIISSFISNKCTWFRIIKGSVHGH